VTGGAGYVGSHMVHALADTGERVVVLDNLTTGFDWSVAPDVPLVVGDTGDQACGFRRLRPGNPNERGHAFRSKAATFSDEGDRGPLPA
jgi:UDP-glucose 4-epimerase